MKKDIGAHESSKSINSPADLIASKEEIKLMY